MSASDRIRMQATKAADNVDEFHDRLDEAVSYVMDECRFDCGEPHTLVDIKYSTTIDESAIWYTALVIARCDTEAPAT